MSRKLLLDDLTAKRITDALRAGNTRSNAAKLGGVAPRTLREWLARGAQGEERFDTFLDAFIRAEAEAERAAVEVVRTAALGGSLAAATFWLERRRPRDWGRRDPVPTTRTSDATAGLPPGTDLAAIYLHLAEREKGRRGA